MITVKIDQIALQSAIRLYCRDTLGIDLEMYSSVNIRLIAGRGSNGHKAEIDLHQETTVPCGTAVQDDPPAPTTEENDSASPDASEEEEPAFPFTA